MTKTNEEKIIEKYASNLDALKVLVKTAPNDATYVHYTGAPYAREPKRKSKDLKPQFMFVYKRGKWVSGNKYVSELNRTYASLAKLRELLKI